MRGIYYIKHVDSGRIYVGSSEDITKRFDGHKRNLKANRHHCRYLQNCWNKYGENAFLFSAIEEVAEGDLTVREQYHIDSTTDDMLLNGSRCAARPLDDPEVKKRQKAAASKHNKARWEDEEYRKKMLEVLRNRETLEVVNLNTGETYVSAKLAEEAIGCCGIYDAINRGGSCAGFYWDYTKNPKGNRVIEDLYKRVVRLDTGEVFKNARDAAEKLGYAESTIYAAIDRGNWCDNSKWDFLDEPKGNTNDITPNKHLRPVRRLDTGELFAGATIASMYYGKNKNSVGSCIRKGVRFLGTYWEYADGNPGGIKNKNPSKPRKPTPVRSVINVNTGKVFNSVVEAAEYEGVSKNTIYNRIFYKKGWDYIKPVAEPQTTV